MISIIIPSKNNPQLEGTLESLKKVKKPEKTEIIVVDASEGELGYIKKKFPKVRWIDFHNKTDKRVTIPEQMNLGLKKSKGDKIVVVVSDCLVEKNWLKKLIKPLNKEKEFFLVGSIPSR
jgi:glycosyltransferase involved in cell wall biosynthesis